MPWFLTSLLSAETVKKRPYYKNLEKRCFGFYMERNNALDAIEENRGNMQECLYSYLVLEKIEEGSHCVAESAEWWRWDTEFGYWTPCERPSEYLGLINFAIG